MVTHVGYGCYSDLHCQILTLSCKIHALDWTKERRPITRRKLVHEVARKLDRYLHDMAVRPRRSVFNFRITHQHTAETTFGYLDRKSVGD